MQRHTKVTQHIVDWSDLLSDIPLTSWLVNQCHQHAGRSISILLSYSAHNERVITVLPYYTIIRPGER